MREEGSEPSRWRRPASWIPVVAAIALMAAIVARALSAIDMTWDTVAYHLPFVALRMGFMRESEFGLAPQLVWYFHGFSPLFDYARGLLWQATGRIEAANLLNIVALALFVLYVWRRWRVPAAWACLALLAIPILQASVSTAYTDVVSNLALAAVILCVAEAWIEPARLRSPGFWGALSLAAVVAGNSKLQTGAICLLALAVLLVAVLRMLYRERPGAARTALVLLGLALLFASANATLIRNAFLFGNPVYPVGVTLGPLTLAGPYDGGDGHHPAYLTGTPQAWRWLLSVLEFRALELRGTTYTVDMGGVPGDRPSARMGGFGGMFVLLTLFAFARAVAARRDRRALVLAAMMALSTLVAASMPASHETRYYLFWMVLLVTATLILLSDGRDRRDALFFKASVSAALAFAVIVTGAIHLRPAPDLGGAIARVYGEFIASRAEPGAVYCAAEAPQFAFLASPALHRALANTVPYRVESSACPDGSVPLPTF